MHPQPRVRFVVGVCTRVFTAEAPETSGIPHAMVLTAYIALSPGTGLSCPRHSRRCWLLANLTPASGRQDHTPLPSASSAFVSRTPQRPPHPAPNVRDDRETPLLMEAGCAKSARDLPDGTSALACVTCWHDGQFASMAGVLGATAAQSRSAPPIARRSIDAATLTRWNMFGEQGAFFAEEGTVSGIISSMRGALATKQSIVSLRGSGMDCFAALAMTRSELCQPPGNNDREEPSVIATFRRLIAQSAATKQSIFFAAPMHCFTKPCHRARICTPRWL